jgi:hypothetical protein
MVRRMRRLIGSSLALLLVACAEPAPSPSAPTATETADAATPEASSEGDDVAELPAPRSEIPPGTYTRSAFAPRVMFELGSGWTAEQLAAGFFDVEQDAGSMDVIAIQFGQVVGHDSADEAAAVVADNLNLVVQSGPEEVALGGQEGIQLTVDTVDPPDTQPPIFRQVISVAAGPLSIASGRRLQLTFVDTGEGLIAVLVGGSIRRWDATLEAATPVLDSLTIEG